MKIDKMLKGICLAAGIIITGVSALAMSYNYVHDGRQNIQDLFQTAVSHMSVPEAEDNPDVSPHEQCMAEADSLRELINIYGDADGSIEALAALLEQCAGDNAEDLLKQAEDKKSEIIASYETAVTRLEKLITRSTNYYEKWQDREGMDVLETACETAREVLDTNTQEKVRNIAALREAYDVLFNVYMENGGNSDPAQYVDNLYEQIAEAEKYQKKYNYISLGQAIREAKTYLNSTNTSELQAQIRALEAEIDRTKEQYLSLVNRMDETCKETLELIKKRFGEEVPETYKCMTDSISSALLPAKIMTDGIERRCTDMELLQKYFDEMHKMCKEIEGLWEQAVDNIRKALNEAIIKSADIYPDNQELKDAIAVVEKKLKDIDALLPAYDTIASVDAVTRDIEDVLMKLEANERRNMADNFVFEYRYIEKNFVIYGSDENSVPTSNAKLFLQEHDSLCTELELPGLVRYTLVQLDGYYKKALKVKDVYQEFCNAAAKLDLKIGEGEIVSDKYFDLAEGTGIDKALRHAAIVRSESMSTDSVIKGTYALQDSIMVTEKLYKENLVMLQNARFNAMSNHNIYYGEKTKTSEIIEVYDEAAAYVGTDDGKGPMITNIFSMVKMTAKLNECYTQAADSCKTLSDKLQLVINKADTLNVLMEDTMAVQLAEAVNAQYTTDARISAVINATVSLTNTLNKFTEVYLDGVKRLQEAVDRARLVADETSYEALNDSIDNAVVILENADPQKIESTRYNILVSAAKDLSALCDKVEAEWKKELGEVLADLNAAREEALRMHILYYGSETDKSEIMDAYRHSEDFLESKDIKAIRKIISELKASYKDASIKNSKSEANLKSLITRTLPLVTLMEDQTIADAIAKAEDALNAEEARLKVMDMGIKALQPVYDSNASSYDKAVVSLGDTIQISKNLLLQVRDEELKLAITEAEAAFMAADKTLETATLFTELNLHKAKLASENVRIREIITSGIYGILADGIEATIFNLQGVPVKKVRLSDKDALNGLPSGIYVVNGTKIIIH